MNARVFWLIPFLIAFFGPAARAVQSGAEDEQFRLSAQYQVQKDSQAGRILVRFELPEGWHTYSLHQESPPIATKIHLKKSTAFHNDGVFKADHEPKITERDPVFDVRLEEFYDGVVFAAPIEIVDGVDPEKLTIELTVTCQVCSESTCDFVKDRKLAVKFDGYYEPKPADKTQKSEPGDGK